MHIDLDHLCDFVGQGGTIKDYALAADVTAYKLHTWINADPDRRKAVDAARATYGQTLAGEMLAIADDGTADKYIDGNGNEKTDFEVVARSKLRVATRQWLAEKYAPVMFGAKTTTELTGPGGGPVQVKRFDMTDEDLAKLAAAGRLA